MAGNIKKSVIDASFILAYLFPEERTLAVEKIMIECRDGQRQLFSPKLLAFETVNAVKYRLVKKGISEEKAEKLVELFLSFDIEYEETDFTETFKLAVKNNLTVYDAAYLSLSLKKKISLLTFDKDLSKFTKN